MQLLDVVGELALAAFQPFLERRQLGAQAFDTLLPKHDVGLELRLAGKELLLAIFELVLREFEMLPALGEPDALRGGQVVGASELGLTFAQLLRSPLEVGLFLGKPRLACGDVGGAACQFTVVAACRQRLTQARRELVHLVGGDLHAKDEALGGGMFGHTRLPLSMSRNPGKEIPHKVLKP